MLDCLYKFKLKTKSKDTTAANKIYSGLIINNARFCISKTFIDNTRQKNQAKANFRYLKIIRFLYQRYHPKIKRHILKT